jgi:predicted glycosyltransferase
MADKNNFIQKLSETKLSCGKSLIELTTYKNIATWRFAEFEFSRRFARRFSVKPKRINLKILKIYKIIEFYVGTLQTILIKIILNFYEIKKNKGGGDCGFPKIFFTAEDREWRTIKDYDVNCDRKSDVFFDSIIKRLKNRYRFVGVSSIAVFPLMGFKIFIEKLKKWDVPQRPFNLYRPLSVWREGEEASKYFIKTWKAFKNDETFKKLCFCNGENFYGQIKKELEYYFYIIFPRAARNIAMAKELIKKENPRLILLQNEFGEFERALIVAGRLSDIPTLAIQHGVIALNLKAYVHAKNEISPNKSVKSPFCPIPDKTAVYGPYAKNFLTKVSAYPNNSVVVTGQPRYDILSKAYKIFNKNEVFEKLNLDKNKKLIVWMPFFIDSPWAENKKDLTAIYNAIKKLSDKTQLVIKKHPSDCGDSTYFKMCKEMNIDPPLILEDKDVNTFELLYACDLMISMYSTAGIEALILNKNVVVMNLKGLPPSVPYVESGAAIGVFKKEYLIDSIEKVLYDKNIQKKLEKAKKKFIYEHAYLQDGKATERVCDLIENMIKESKNER